MSDSLVIEDLEIWTRIGLKEQERTSEQRLLVTITLELEHAGRHADNLDQSIDYAAVAFDVRALAAKERLTIEFFAEETAETILKKYHPHSIRVTVKKFALPGCSGASLTIERP